MNADAVAGLFDLCNRINPDLSDVENYIVQNGMTSEEITRAAIRLAARNCYETIEFIYMHDRAPRADELVSTNWCGLFDVLLRHGLNPNLVICEAPDEYENIMELMYHIDNGNISLQILGRLLDHGGDPNTMLGGETLFGVIHTAIDYDSVGLENRALFDLQFKFWLMLLGHGGKLAGGYPAVVMKNGFTADCFREYDRFSYRTEVTGTAHTMHVFQKDSGVEVAEC